MKSYIIVVMLVDVRTISMLYQGFHNPPESLDKIAMGSWRSRGIETHLWKWECLMEGSGGG